MQIQNLPELKMNIDKEEIMKTAQVHDENIVIKEMEDIKLEEKR